MNCCRNSLLCQRDGQPDPIQRNVAALSQSISRHPACGRYCGTLPASGQPIIGGHVRTLPSATAPQPAFWRHRQIPSDVRQTGKIGRMPPRMGNSERADEVHRQQTSDDNAGSRRDDVGRNIPNAAALRTIAGLWTPDWSDVLVDELVFRHMRRIQWTRHHQFTLHSAAEDDFDNVGEVLLCAETANELCVIWCPIQRFHTTL